MSRRPGQRFDSLRAIEKALALPLPPGRSMDELRTEAIAAMLLPDFEVAKQWPGWPHGTTAVAIDPSFQRYAHGDADGNVSVRRIDHDVELFQLPGEGTISDYGGLAFSPNGRFLMQCCETSQGRHRRIWKLGGPQPVVALSCYTTFCGFAFSPDGKQFVASLPGGSIRLYDLETGRELNRFELAGYVPIVLAWNPRRPVLATSDYRAAYRLLDLTTGKLAAPVQVPDPTTWIDWHPDGRLLALGGDNPPRPTITVWDTVTNRLALPPMESHTSLGVLVRFNHSGDRLLSTDWAGLWRLWDTRTGQLLLTQPAGGVELTFSQDDGLAGLAAAAESLRFFRFRSGRETCTVLHRSNSVETGYTSGNVGSCQLDPDGRLLAIPARDGVAVVDAVVDIVRGEEIAIRPLGDNWIVGGEPSGALLTHGAAGVVRWPVKVNVAASERVYGPPERLFSTMTQLTGDVGKATDGRVLAFPENKNGARELLLPEGREFQLTPQEDVRHCAVSPDGSWIATGSHGAVKGPGAEVWDARTGRHVCDLPVAAFSFVSFSPNGKWLLTTGGGGGSGRSALGARDPSSAVPHRRGLSPPTVRCSHWRMFLA